MGRAERDCHLDGHLNGGARPRNSTWSASNDPISQVGDSSSLSSGLEAVQMGPNGTVLLQRASFTA